MSERETIKAIESQTEGDIVKMLQRAGLGKSKYKIGDYSKAKEIVFMRRWIDCDIYDKQIKWICDYLKI